jgi:hypothetical protein
LKIAGPKEDFQLSDPDEDTKPCGGIFLLDARHQGKPQPVEPFGLGYMYIKIRLKLELNYQIVFFNY